MQPDGTSPRAKNNISAGVASIPAGEKPLVVQADVLATAAQLQSDPIAAPRYRSPLRLSQEDGGAAATPSGAPLPSDPAAAVQALSKSYADAPLGEKDALLNSATSQKIIGDAAQWANEPLRIHVDGVKTQAGAPMLQAITRLDRVTAVLDRAVAAAIVERAVSGYEDFIKANQSKFYLDQPFGPVGMRKLIDISSRIHGTKPGDAAISRFARTGAWNSDMVRTAIAEGGDPAYAVEMARQLKADGQDPGIVLQAIKDGVAEIGGEAANAIRELAALDGELAWLVNNNGGGCKLQQLNDAIADYRAKKDLKWKAEEAKLSEQLAGIGAKLLDKMAFLDQTMEFSRQDLEQILREIANNPFDELAIIQALKTKPGLLNTKSAKEFADIFSLSKVGDIGRKYTNELASLYLRRTVLAKLEGVNLSNVSSIAQAKEAIGRLQDETFARLIGVTPDDLGKAVAEVQTAVDAVANGQDPATALKGLNDALKKDASLSKTFNKTTFPGQLLRGVAVAFAGASVINSYNKYHAQSDDPQNLIKLVLDAAGFAQKNVELLVGAGAISRDSLPAKFGGEWKAWGRASAGDFIAGVSVVLDGISTVRYGFGLGVEQDIGNAAFSFTTMVGGGLTLSPTLFGWSAWLGPAGLGITAAGIVGKMIYDSAKDAHKYEKVSRAFLIAAGYSDAAAGALSRQVPFGSGSARGSAQMPILAKYARIKHLEKLQEWVSGLSPKQLNELSELLLATASDTHGNPDEFTDGPLQTRTIHTRTDGDFQVVRLNTVQAFDNELDRVGIQRYNAQ
jgi:hypothetical protein